MSDDSEREKRCAGSGGRSSGVRRQRDVAGLNSVNLSSGWLPFAQRRIGISYYL
jgi:hypothetical protein